MHGTMRRVSPSPGHTLWAALGGSSESMSGVSKSYADAGVGQKMGSTKMLISASHRYDLNHGVLFFALFRSKFFFLQSDAFLERWHPGLRRITHFGAHLIK